MWKRIIARENVDEAYYSYNLPTCCGEHVVRAGTREETLENSLADSAYAFTIQHGKLGGGGAAVLQDAISHADFVLLGEDHLSREIPRLAAAICDAMGQSGGFSAMAFEARRARPSRQDGGSADALPLWRGLSACPRRERSGGALCGGIAKRGLPHLGVRSGVRRFGGLDYRAHAGGPSWP